jgi:uncharacterized radical SAM superfamily Fe-S cluster-containing enzyme
MKKNLPTIVLSSDAKQKQVADDKCLTFIDKNDEDLYQKLIHQVTQKIGFGDFIFKTDDDTQITRVSTLREFEKTLKKVPQESIDYHAKRDDFSLWLMARSEIQLAKILEAKKAHHFKDIEEIRSYILKMLKAYRDEKPQGKVVPWRMRIVQMKKIFFYFRKELTVEKEGAWFLSIHCFTKPNWLIH